MSEDRFITIDGEEVKVTDEMIFGGSFACQTCNHIDYEAIMLAGTLYWVCPNGHGSKVVLYE